MTRIARRFVSLFMIVSTAGWAFAVAPAGPGTAPKLEDYGKLPLSFEANQGQTDAQVRFLSRGNGYSLFLTPTEAVLTLKKTTHARHAAASTGLAGAAAESTSPATVLRMKLVGSNASAEIAGADELPGKSNYFIGNDLKKWVIGVRTYGSVEYRNVYPGVDLVYYGNQRQLEHDFVVAPGADPTAISLDLKGAKRIFVSPGGDVVMDTPEGEVRLRQPKIYQMIGGEQITVDGRYVRTGETRVGFEIAAYDRGQPLVIDPVLSYSTYIGGSGSDQGNAIAVDSGGNVYVAGVTGSTNFPVANAANVTNGGGNDAFVTKVNAAGSAVVYSTYMGGNGNDSAYGIAVDSGGNAYVTGTTSSTNFPAVKALFGKFGGGFDDAFVVKINPAGSALVYSTYLGGNSDDGGFGIAVNSKGNAFITGSTGSTNFPIAHALYAKLGGADDAFVAELNAVGSALIYSTYLGGSNGDGGMAIALDSIGFAYVTGETFSANFPTAKALYPKFGGGFADAFVAKINSAGSALVYSTFLGGNDFDLGQGIALDAAGNAYVTGETFSANFPTAHALYPTYRGVGNAFITKINSAGSALVYSTYMGGTGGDGSRGIAVDGAGNAYVTGTTGSQDFPTANAFHWTQSGFDDAFVAKINAAGSALVYSTYMGGSSDDFGQGIAVDGAGNAYVAGYTLSTNFPTANALHRANSGGDDIFVAKIFDSNAGSADLSVSNVAAPNPVSPSENITYTIALSNAGPNLANSVTLTDALPAQTKFISCSATGGGFCANSGNSVKVSFPNLANGARATVTLVAQVGSTVPIGSLVNNTATVVSKTADPMAANNSSTATSAISAQAGPTQQFAGPVSLNIKSATLAATSFSGILGVADFNNDGRKDILGIYYANNGAGQCAVLMGNSDGSYSPQLTGITLGKGSGDTVEVADVDGDGRQDIIVVTAPVADAQGDPLGTSLMKIYLGNGDSTFRALPAVTVSTQFASLALVADLDKNGKPDLVISEHPGDFTTISFRVWTNQGAGKFKAAYSVGSSTSIAVLAQGDFNRDGYPDIVMEVSAGLQVFLNNKGTGFTAGATYPISATVAAAGDLNHDGMQDLVAVEFAGHNGHILLGKGDGTFRTGSTFAISSNPAGPAADVSPASAQIADLNGDRLPDVSVVTYVLSDASGGSDLQIFAGDGAGSVGNPNVFNIGGALQTSFIDVNRDGKLELLLSGVGLNGGPVRGYSIAPNTGPGFFSAPRESTLFGPNSIVTADFNKDSNADIAVVSDAVTKGSNGAVVVYTGSGKGYFNVGRSYAIGMRSGVLAVGDVNGDGKLDLVVARSAAYLSNSTLGVAARSAVVMNSVDSASGKPVRTAAEQQRRQAERSITAHDLPQMQTATSPDASSSATDLSVLLGVGDGTFKPAMNFKVLGVPGQGDRDNFATLADVNHDGKLDLIGDWGAALGKGDGSFAGPIPLASSLKNIVQMASGDFNGDGGFDLAVATSTNPPSGGAVYALFGSGKGSFFVSPPQQLAGTDDVYALAIADMNGDGKGDLVFDASQAVNHQKTTRNLTVRLLNGSVSFASPINYPLALSSFVPPIFEFVSPLIIGDFNRDGKRDVLYLGEIAQPGKIPGGRLTLLPGLGNGRLSATPQYFSTQMQQGVVLNLNSDGAPDVVGVTAIGVTRLLNSGTKATVTK